MKIVKPIDFSLLSSNVPDSGYPIWDSATTYANGDTVYVDSNHGEYVSLVDSNVGNDPIASPSAWQWISTTNRWRMFDQYLNTQTEYQDSIRVEIDAYGAEAVYLGNIDGVSLHIQVVDKASGNVIEDETLDLMTDPLDWEYYFYDDWIDEYRRNVYYERQTLARDVKIVVELSAPSATAKIGIFVVGSVAEIGATLYDFTVSALDYSKKVTDQNSGATFLQQGNYVKTASLDIFAYTSGIDTVYRKLVEVRGLPVVFVGGDMEIVTIYGFVRKFETLVKTPVHTIITIDIEGLI